MSVRRISVLNLGQTMEKDELTCLFQPYFFMFCLLGIDTQPSLGKWTEKQMWIVYFDARFNKFVQKKILLDFHISNNKKPNHNKYTQKTRKPKI